MTQSNALSEHKLAFATVFACSATFAPPAAARDLTRHSNEALRKAITKRPH